MSEVPVNAKILPVLIVALALAPGCIHTSRTEVKDESRMAVEFENEVAGRVFYEALSKRPDRRNREESNTKVSLPIGFSNEYRVIQGPNHAFNQSVRECDTNHDARITESEARIWAGSR